FAEPLGERCSQAPQLLNIRFAVLVAAAPSVGHRVARVVEGKADQSMPALIPQKIRPATLVGGQGANDKYPALIARALLHLLSKPIQLVVAPGRTKITRRHHDDENTGALYFGTQLVSEMDCRVDLFVTPNMQIIKFRIDRADIRLQSPD